MIIRWAVAEDLPALLVMLHELAAFEGGAVSASLDDLQNAFQAGRIEALTAQFDGAMVGMLTVLPSFSSWRGRAGAVIHDFYVRPTARRHGIGRALVSALFDAAKARNWDRIDVNVLDWNGPAQAFYDSLGLAAATGWQIRRIEGEALEKAGAVK